MHLAIIQSKDLWLGTILSTLQQDHIALAIRQLCRQHQPCGARADLFVPPLMRFDTRLAEPFVSSAREGCP